jgi:hypothetical protein
MQLEVEVGVLFGEIHFQNGLSTKFDMHGPGNFTSGKLSCSYTIQHPIDICIFSVMV